MIMLLLSVESAELGIDALSCKRVWFELLISLEFKKGLLQFITNTQRLFLTRAEKVIESSGNDLKGLVGEVIRCGDRGAADTPTATTRFWRCGAFAAVHRG